MQRGTSSITERTAERATALDKALYQAWALGRYIILCWSPTDRGLKVLRIPHYAVVATAASPLGKNESSLTADGRPDPFMNIFLAGDKKVHPDDLSRLSRLLDSEPLTINLGFDPIREVGLKTIELLIRRYGISYVEDRAVVLFDIVRFSLFSPLEQVAQLNSLAYSLNQAHSKLVGKNVEISFTRTTTGDGFYIWNRDRSIQANINLYRLMHLVLADNVIAHAKSVDNTVPLLRTAFHVGGHYEFYQSEGLNPTIYSYIVGDVTIELARLISRAMPGQILVGEFDVPMEDDETRSTRRVGTIHFIERAQKNLLDLRGTVIAGEEIEMTKCYLTGAYREGVVRSIRKYEIPDKHGRTRGAFNAKINIYRKSGPPIFLGLQDSDLLGFRVREDIPV